MKLRRKKCVPEAEQQRKLQQRCVCFSLAQTNLLAAAPRSHTQTGKQGPVYICASVCPAHSPSPRAGIRTRSFLAAKSCEYAEAPLFAAQQGERRRRARVYYTRLATCGFCRATNIARSPRQQQQRPSLPNAQLIALQKGSDEGRPTTDTGLSEWPLFNLNLRNNQNNYTSLSLCEAKFLNGGALKYFPGVITNINNCVSNYC